MPFTLVHPAAVLLLARGPLSLLALVAGAVAPDVPYYLRVLPLQVTADSWYEPYVNATSSHSLAQLIPVALPLALAVYACGWFLLPPLRSIAGLEASGEPTSGLVAVLLRGGWVVVSLTIGVLTHVGWDALTEVGGSGSGFLQHGSTVVGFLLLAVVAHRRRTAIRWHDPVVRRNLVTTSALCALGALAGAVVTAWSWLDPDLDLSTGEIVEGVIVDGAKGAGVGLVAAAVVLALGWWVRQVTRRQDVSSAAS